MILTHLMQINLQNFTQQKLQAMFSQGLTKIHSQTHIKNLRTKTYTCRYHVSMTTTLTHQQDTKGQCNDCTLFDKTMFDVYVL